MAEKSVSDLLLAEVVPFTKGSLMTTDPSTDNAEDAAVFYRIVDFVEKLCKSRKEALKPVLHQYAEAQGEKTEKGGYVSTTGVGFKVTRERRSSSTPDPDGLKTLLKEAGIDLTEAFTTIKMLQLDMSKVNFLVESGKLDEDAVQSLYAISWALKVAEGKETKPLLAQAK